MGMRQRLVALDRAAIGRAYDAPTSTVPRRVTWLAAGYPVLTGGVTAAAFAQSKPAGVGVLVGPVLALPLAYLAKLTSGR